MDIGKNRRIVQKVLSHCLGRIRLFGDLPEEKFSEKIADLPDALREFAAQIESPSVEGLTKSEPPGWEGYALWAGNYDRWDDNLVIQAEESVIWDMIGDPKGLEVLDVGCGTGRHAIPLARDGARVTGIEPVPEMLQRAIEKAREESLDIRFRAGSIDLLDSGLGRFDLVLCCLVLSHVPDLADAIRRLAAHVKPGGRIVVSDLHPTNILLGYRTSCSAGGQNYVVPNYLQQPSEYFAALASAGLTVTGFHELGEDPRFPGLPQTLIMEARRAVHRKNREEALKLESEGVL